MSLDKYGISKRIAQEMKDGMYVNLGIGIHTLVSHYIPEGMTVIFQSDNGILGMGPYPAEAEEDEDLIYAGKETVTLIPGGAFFDSAESFGMRRAGNIDSSVLGDMEVGQDGHLATGKIHAKMAN